MKEIKCLNLNESPDDRAVIFKMLTEYSEKEVFNPNFSFSTNLYSYQLSHVMIKTKQNGETVYEVIDNNWLDSGNFGEIYRSIMSIRLKDKTIEIRSSSLVAKATIYNKNDLERGHNEVKILKHIGYGALDAIVAPYSIKQVRLYIFFNYFAGLRLDKFLAQQRTLTQSYYICSALIEELLVTFHNMGIIHRDISKENIIVLDSKKGNYFEDGSYKVKYVDGGNATFAGDNELYYGGTAEFMAPECHGGLTSYKSDGFSLGKLLKMIMEPHFQNRIPFFSDQKDNENYAKNSVSYLATYTAPLSLALKMRACINSLLERDPEKRAELTSVSEQWRSFKPLIIPEPELNISNSSAAAASEEEVSITSEAIEHNEENIQWRASPETVEGMDKVFGPWH